ncbi:Gmad2 immunoglobulin-like domain-containing protein [Kribbella sp. NPDC051770]|uniref:Gmad2 immunoglobulin-like domain-containing protein n=1 Tax=Kribbella sp. NPDC051770 TaxID=3155413 RepID=UPI00341A815E
MNDQPNNEFDELMRRALHSEADRIEPADGLHEIQARVSTARKPVNRRPWVLTAGAAVVGTAAAIGAFAVLNGENRQAGDSEVAGAPDTTASATGTPQSPKPSATLPSPSAYAPTDPGTPKVKPTQAGKLEPESSGAVPVYWLGATDGSKTGAGVKLYRTFAPFKGRPAYAALQLMTSGKSTDPDYSSPWVGARVSEVRQTGSLTTVDFKALPKTRLDPEVANLALQQLVYTVQGASGASVPVQLTLQGRPVAQVFGTDITQQPLGRAQALDVQALIWITAPENDAVLSTPFKVTGVAAVNEAQLNWRITSASNRRVVDEGTAMTQEAFKFSDYTFVVDKLPAGRYTLEVFEVSAEDGRQTSTDTKTLVVK